MASNLQSGNNEELQKLVKNFFSDEKPKSLTILVTGKTGVGKSRLVNALVGKNVAKEGKKKGPCTSEVSLHHVIIEGVKVTVCDSPGLQDGTGNEDLYIKDMKEKIENIDLMIYCIKMDDTRFHDADKKAIRILTDEFGKEVWNHAVVALTFANKVEDPDEEDELEYFEDQLQEWKQQVEDHFKDISRALHIPSVIPAGNWLKMHLPDRENWLSDLWIGCYEALKASARQGMYRINRNRLTTSPTTPNASANTRYSSEAEYDDMIPNEIPLQDHHQERFWKSTLEGILCTGEFVLGVVAGVGGTALLLGAGTVGGAALQGAGTVAGAALQGAGTVAGAALQGAGTVAGAALQGVGTVAGAALQGVGTVGGAALQGVGTVAGAALQEVGTVAGAALQGVGTVAGAALQGVGTVGGTALQGVGTVGGTALQGVGTVGGAALQGVGTVGETAAETLRNANGKIIVRIGRETMTIDLFMLGVNVFKRSFQYR